MAVGNWQSEIKPYHTHAEGTPPLSSPDNPQFEPQASAEPQASTPSARDPFSPASVVPLSGLPLPAPPAENPVWTGWDVLAIAALTFVTMVVLHFAGAKVAQLRWYPRERFVDALQAVEQLPIFQIASQFLLYIPWALYMIMTVEGKYRVPFWRAISWNWPRARWWLIGLGAATLIVLTLLQNLLPMPKHTPFEHLFDRPRDAYLISIIAVTLGPLLEELFFRGLLYPVLARRMGVVWGIILTALPFGLIHLPQYGDAWAVGLVIFLVGVVCGAVRAATKSVAASFLVHVGYNATDMLLMMLATDGFRHLEKAIITL